MGNARPVTACASTLVITLAGGLFGSSSAATGPEPTAVAGTLPAAADIREAKVYAIDDDSDLRIGESLSQTEVTATFTRSGKRYTLRIDPAQVPAKAIDSGGVVDLELRFSSARSTWITFVSSRLVKNKSSSEIEWVDPMETLPEVGSAVARLGGSPSRRLATVPSRTGLGVPRTTVKDLGRPIPAYSRIARVDADSAACDYRYVKESNRSTTIATSYPYGASTSWLDVTHTEGGTYGIAFNVGTGTGFSAKGTKYAGGGWGATWPKFSGMRSYRIGVNYHYYEGGCGGSKWTPHIETGGATQNTVGLTRPTWNGMCDNVGNGIDWRRYKTSGHAYSYNTGVKFKDVIGVDLSANKDYSSNHTLWYRIAGKPKKLCGNNDYPSYAGKIVERLR